MAVFIRPELTLQLGSCNGIPDHWRKKLAIASIISQVYIDNNLEPPVIVGGLVVSTYSFGRYGTDDIDLLSTATSADKEIMSALGYVKAGKDYLNKTLLSYVEFPSGSLRGSYAKVQKYLVEETNLYVFVEGVEDIILYRLNSFVATKDNGSREWAARMILSLYPYIDWSYIHGTAHKQGVLDALNRLQRELKRYNNVYKQSENETSATTGNRMNLF